MARPPDDESRLDAILNEVRDALDEAGISNDGIRGALLDGVRDALGELGGEQGGPEMTVVDGGRSAGEPRAEGAPPELTIADGEKAPEPSRIKVFVTREESKAREEVVTDGRGRIAVSDGTQTVFHGAVARAYRLHCDAGVLRVSLDGQPAESLSQGQSLDVEARLIRLSAQEDAGGWYTRLPGV